MLFECYVLPSDIYLFFIKKNNSYRQLQKKAHGQRAAVASAVLSAAYSHRLLKKRLHHEFNAHSGLEDYLQNVKSVSVVSTSISDVSCEMGFARFQ